MTTVLGFELVSFKTKPQIERLDIILKQEHGQYILQRRCNGYAYEQIIYQDELKAQEAFEVLSTPESP